MGLVYYGQVTAFHIGGGVPWFKQLQTKKQAVWGGEKDVIHEHFLLCK
jgi:hypothetical protein